MPDYELAHKRLGTAGLEVIVVHNHGIVTIENLVSNAKFKLTFEQAAALVNNMPVLLEAF